MFHVPNKYRAPDAGPLSSTNEDGNNGVFVLPLTKFTTAFVIASDGFRWEHVSVHVKMAPDGKKRIPTWEEMCKIKEVFWDDEDVVVQYHPKKSEYVNNDSTVLHLWRSTDIPIPTPPSVLVGVK